MTEQAPTGGSSIDSAASALSAGLGVCIWTPDGEGSFYTACDQYWTVMEGSPAENGMNFCHHCGKSLRVSDHDAEEVLTGVTRNV